MSAAIPDNSTLKASKVLSEIWYQSDFCEVKNWNYDFQREQTSSKGYNDCLCIVFVRKGNFLMDLGSNSYNAHTGHVIIDKPDYEYSLRPATGQCTIFNFTAGFYAQLIEDCSLKYSFFFSNANILSLLLKTTPALEYLHHQILSKSAQPSKLEIDQLVLEMVRQIVTIITGEVWEDVVDMGLKGFHFATIERAKEYIHQHFSSDITLSQVAEHACVSPFHFSRIFKQFTSYSPYQYLLGVRLTHSELLLRNSQMPIGDVAIAAGFNSQENFAVLFKQKNKITPREFRKQG